jgi:hypothetical protein
MNRRLLYLFPLLPFLLGAEVYRYVDSNGIVTYTERLPEGVQGERIMAARTGPSQTVRDADGTVTAATPSAAGTGAPANERVDLSKDQQAMLEQLRKTEDARRQQLARIREANCTRSRDVLARLSVSGRIRVTDASGQERAMPEEERQQRVREAQDGIVANCDPGA